MANIYSSYLNNPDLFIYGVTGGGLVIAIFISFVVKLRINTNQVITKLNELTKILRQKLDKSYAIDKGTLEAIDENLKKEILLTHNWNEFKETLIFNLNDESEKSTVLATKSIEEYFDREVILEEKTSLGFFRQVPGILTSLGLALTFCFIVIGLMHMYVPLELTVEMPTNLVKLEESTVKFKAKINGENVVTEYEIPIPGNDEPIKINNLSSLAPETKAILVELSGKNSTTIRMKDGEKNKIELMDKREISIDPLIKSLGGKFISSITALMLSLVYLVYLHKREIKCVKALEELTSLLDNKLTRVTPEYYLRELSLQQRSTSKIVEPANVETVALLKSVDARLEELVGVMKPFGSQIGMQLGDIVVNGFQNSLSLSTEQIVAAVQGIQNERAKGNDDILKGILKDFKETMMQSTGADFSGLQKTVGELSQSLSVSGETNRVLASELKEVVLGLKEGSSQTRNALNESVSHLIAEVNTLLSKLSEAGLESSKSMNTNLVAMTNEVSNLISQFRGVGKESVEDVEKIAKITSEESRKRSEATSQIIEKMLNGQGNLTIEFSKVLDLFKGANAELLQGAQRLKEVLSQTESSSRIIKEAMENNTTTVSRLADVSTSSQNQLSKLLEVDKGVRELMTTYSSFFPQSEQGIKRIIETLNQELINYNQKTSEGLGNVLTEYDRNLSKAVTTFNESITQLNDTFQEMTDKLNKPSKAA